MNVQVIITEEHKAPWALTLEQIKQAVAKFKFDNNTVFFIPPIEIPEMIAWRKEMRLDIMPEEFVGNAFKPYRLIIDESSDIYKMFDLALFDVRLLDQYIVKIPITDENDPGIFKECERGNVVQCKLTEEAKANYKIGSRFNDELTACAEDNTYLLDNLTLISVMPLEMFRTFSGVKCRTLYTISDKI